MSNFSQGPKPDAGLSPKETSLGAITSKKPDAEKPVGIKEILSILKQALSEFSNVFLEASGHSKFHLLSPNGKLNFQFEAPPTQMQGHNNLSSNQLSQLLQNINPANNWNPPGMTGSFNLITFTTPVDSGALIFHPSQNGSLPQITTHCSGGGGSHQTIDLNQIHPAGAIGLKKPVIYLYPEVPQEVSVSITLPQDSKFSALYPKMHNGRWHVLANPSGELIDMNNDRRYTSLFWEAEQTSEFSVNLSRAFSIQGNTAEDFLEEALTRFGLNIREKTEFIVYWLPHLQTHRNLLIEFLTTEYTEKYPLVISPTPNSLLRVFMVYKPTDGPVFDAKGVLPINPPLRNGFTVVEWGGAELNSNQIRIC